MDSPTEDSAAAGRAALFAVVLLGACASVALADKEGAASPSPSPEKKPPSFNALRTPTSPAFTLLGIAPSSVERPNSPSSLALSLLSRTDSFSDLPKDFALEFSPYWLVSHRRLTWQSDNRRTVPESLARTLTVSGATAQTGTAAAPVTSLAVGARVAVLSGTLSKKTETALQELESRLGRQGTLALELLAPKLAPLEARLRAGTIDVDEFDREKRRLLEEVLQSEAYLKHPLLREAQSFAVDREGFLLEAAGAGSWEFPGNSWEQRRARQWGAWLTPSYVRGRWSLVAVGRYLSDESRDEGALELGARGIYSRDEYAISLEYLHHEAYDSGESGDRVVGVLEYEVGDGSWVVASFGKGRQADGGSGLVAQLGLTLNFSRERHRFE